MEYSIKVMLKTSAKLKQTLGDLISFKTISNDLEENEACLQYIEKYLKPYPLNLTRHNSRGIQSLVASTSELKHSKVILQAHMDVVPGNSELFKMREKDGRLFGRGVYEMKFVAACYLQLVEEIKDELENLSLSLVFTTDEEVGGFNGVKYLLDQGYTCDVAVIPDGGDNWEIESRCNDVWIIDLIADGVAAHGSRPWEGDNAINKLMEGLIDIRRLFGNQEPGKSSLTISQIQGGYAENQVPDSAKATLDMRFVDYRQYQIFRKAIQLVASERNLKIKTSVMYKGERVPLDHPKIREFLDVAKKVHGQPIKPIQSLGSSDAHFFAEQNIPTIVIRPKGGAAHSEEEWIDEESLIQFYELLRKYVKEASSVTTSPVALDSDKVPV